MGTFIKKKDFASEYPQVKTGGIAGSRRKVFISQQKEELNY